MQDPPPALTDDDARRPAAVVVGRPGKTTREDRTRGNAGRRPASFWLSVAGSVAVGVVAALLGTALHAQGTELAGVRVPLGALAAVVLVGSAAVFAAVSARNVYLSPVVGAVAYLVVGWFAAVGTYPLVLTDTSGDPALPAAIAGSIWVFGVAVATVLATLVSWWALRPRRSGRLRAVKPRA